MCGVQVGGGWRERRVGAVAFDWLMRYDPHRFGKSPVFQFGQLHKVEPAELRHLLPSMLDGYGQVWKYMLLVGSLCMDECYDSHSFTLCAHTWRRAV